MDYATILDRVSAHVAGVEPAGKVADYIPELAKVDPRKFGMSLRTVDGHQVDVGDSEERFSIQSIAKVLLLAFALSVDPEGVLCRVGVEPSGTPFNSLVQLEYENGIPRNPLINAGAIVVADILLSSVDSPKQHFLEFVRRLSGCPDVAYNERVARSESAYGFRNLAVANFMKGFGNVRNDVDRVLDFYFHMCSLEMSCSELVKTFIYFADPVGNNPMGSEFLSPSQVKRINAVMLTCGFYDEAGEFAFSVGLPGKSGVGGGIVAVCPGKFSTAVWSPRLNPHGNSHLGTEALAALTSMTGLSIF